MAEKEKQKIESGEEEPEKKVAETKEEKKQEAEKSEKEIKKFEKKKKKLEKPKKTEAIVKANNLPISTKHSVAICKFIKNKKIDDALADLEEVIKEKKAVPMKGEIPHRRGKMMSGRYLKKAAQQFIKLLKTLKGNAIVNGLDEDVKIKIASANIGERPYGRFGFHRKKRSHVLLKAQKDKKQEAEKEKKLKNK